MAESRESSASDLLTRMLLIRRFDERLLRLQKQGLIPGHTSPYIGQEAIAVGVAAELAEGDFVASHHRPTGHALMAGLDPGRVLAELLGRVGGYCRGKAGKHQLTSLEHGFLGANGVVGGGIPLAVGAALGQKLRGTNGVTVAYFGDGATNTGAFHEAVNLAAVWNLPVLFVCETTATHSRRDSRITSATLILPTAPQLMVCPGRSLTGTTWMRFGLLSAQLSIPPALDMGPCSSTRKPTAGTASTMLTTAWPIGRRRRSIAGRNAAPSKLIALGSKHEAR